MLLTYLMLLVALCLSAVAAFYSIVGLTAIFAAAVMPIIIMGSILEVAKLVVTVWLHEYWKQAKLTMKMYLVPAVGMLMLITSMGIFGFLSKAHLDQGMVSGDVQAKIAIYDEKIRTERENIDVNRKALKQMDEAVDQVMGRSSDEKGADKAVAVRRAQQKERARLLTDIAEAQKKITSLNEQRAPIAAEVRKVEAEVGPIKYIAALIYDDNPDANVLEKAVRWVIILLVIVFDPLAVMMLLASTESMKWERENRARKYEQDDGPLTDDQISQLREAANAFNLPTDKLFTDNPHTPGWMFTKVDDPVIEDEKITCYLCGTELVNAPGIGPFCPNKQCDVLDNTTGAEIEFIASAPVQDELPVDADITMKSAIKAWKHDNPNKTIKEQRNLFERGVIDQLPWEEYLHKGTFELGSTLPESAQRGDLFVIINTVPTQLYKHTGESWINIDKTSTSQYLYDDVYIEFLIDAISKGQYDPELLTDGERAEIETRLNRSV